MLEVQEFNDVKQTKQGAKIVLDGVGFSITVAGSTLKKSTEIAEKITKIGEVLYLLETIADLDGIDAEILKQIKEFIK